ncbi:MAG: HAD-IIA family hydrolase [Clostridia bacterium]|nr:HAD-IIA family hydrolase [Clostridia bacterium]
MTKEELKKIKLFLMDMDGTVYIGPQKIPGAFEALETLRRNGRRICFLTNNSSRSQDQYVEHLRRYDFEASMDEVYTSALATCGYLNKHRKGAKVFALATPRVREEMRRAGVNVIEGYPTEREDYPDVVVVAFDTTLTYDRLYAACRYINAGAYYVATHPDNFCPAPECNMPDMGGFIAMIEKTIDRLPDVIIGKPYAPMAEAVGEKFGLRPEEIAMVGDRLYTDIRFGVDNGFAGILVMTGETTPAMLADSPIKPTLVLDTFADVLDLLDLR